MFSVGCNSFMMNSLLSQIGHTIGQPIEVTSQGITFFNLTYFFSASLFSLFFVSRLASSAIKFALILLLLGNLVTMFSENILAFLAGRALTGLGAGIFSPLCVSVAVHSVSLSTRGRILSFIWGANSAGVVFGGPVGHYLSTLFNWQLSIIYIITLNLFALIGFCLQKMNINLLDSTPFKERLKLLSDRRILCVIGITCATCMASLGLYSYVSVIQIGYSLTIVMFIWGLGGFFGSSLVGIFIDYTKSPHYIMAIILASLMLIFFTLPFFITQHHIGLVLFFLWGAFAWATTVPQQHILFGIKKNQNLTLAAFNASAIGLGGSLGTAIGGLIIASGFKENILPFFASLLLLIVFISHLILTLKFKQRV